MKLYAQLAPEIEAKDVATPPANWFWRWPVSTASPGLGAEEVHVWCARLDLGQARRAELLDSLSADERARAARYVFPQDRQK